jgi:hypothetical protein
MGVELERTPPIRKQVRLAPIVEMKEQQMNAAQHGHPADALRAPNSQDTWPVRRSC